MRVLRIAGCAIALTALAVGCNEVPTAVDDGESALFGKGGKKGKPGGGDGDIRFLTSGANTNDYRPCLVDDHTVLFNRWAEVDGVDQSALFTVDLTNGDPAQPLPGVPDGVSARRPGCSVDSDWMAYSVLNAPAPDDVWVINEGGSTYLVSEGSTTPSWYPSATYLAVQNTVRNVVMKVDPLGVWAQDLTDPSRILAGKPDVSPDGLWLAFAGQINNGQEYDAGNNSIWVTSLEGDPASKSYTEVSKGQGQPSQVPAWSPDGEWLAYQQTSTQPIGRSYAIFLMHVIDGSGNIINEKKRRPRRVTSFELNAQHPEWSPDGTLLVFSARNPEGGQSIAVMNAP